MDSTFDSTNSTDDPTARAFEPQAVGVRILWHPNPGRVDEMALLFDRGRAQSAKLGRDEPQFRTPHGAVTGSLATQYVSRAALTLRQGRDSSVELDGCERRQVLADGMPVDRSIRWSAAQLERGVVLQLGKQVLLWLGVMHVSPYDPPGIPELLGTSNILVRLRHEIRLASALEAPLLIYGQTGTGKQLVAQAVHRLGPGAAGPLETVNMAAIPGDTATTELFGHARGAFTGAVRAKKGYFGKADGGSLVLDGLCYIDRDVQPILLDALDEGFIQPTGGNRERVRVRVMATSDIDVGVEASAGRFNAALVQRFGYEIRVPPLRDHLEDVPGLFLHWLGEALGCSPEELSGPSLRLDAREIRALLTYDWPGNVRELRRFAQRIALEQRTHPDGIAPSVRQLLHDMRSANAFQEPTPSAPAPTIETPEESWRSAELTDADIVAAMQRCDFRIMEAATELKVSRSYLTGRIPGIPGLRVSTQLQRAEIKAALEAAHGDVAAAARLLTVSARALQLQMKRLGLR